MAIYQGHNEDSSGNILLSIGNGMTATVETGTKASQAYTKGAYLFFNNRLCKASSAISSGATLTIGSNLTQTSLGAEITSHLRSSDGKEFYFDVKNGQYGYYPSASKTASEFVPFGGTPQLLWTNPSMNASFAAQKVSLNLTNYSGVIIHGKWSDNRTGYLVQKIYVDKGSSNVFAPITIFASYGYGRKVTVDSTGVTFSNGATQAEETTGYNIVIPTYIYGI